MPSNSCSEITFTDAVHNPKMSFQLCMPAGGGLAPFAGPVPYAARNLFSAGFETS